MDSAAGSQGRYSIANDWINVSIENARLGSDGSPDGFAKAFTHEVFHRALNFTLDVERSKWLSIWRADPTGIGRSAMDMASEMVANPAISAVKMFDDLSYRLSPNEAFANSGMRFLDDVVTGRYQPGSAKTGVYGYLDDMFRRAKQVIGLAPKESQRAVANRFMDQFMQRIRQDGAMLPNADMREAIYGAFEAHGREMAINLLLDASGALQGLSAEAYIQATRQLGAEPEMRVSSIVQSADNFLDSDKLIRKETSIAPTGIGLEKWNWSPWHWAMGSVSENVRNIAERLVATPGLKLTKNMSLDAHGNVQAPQPMVRSVETSINVNWRPKLSNGLQALRESWLEQRGAGLANPNFESLKLGAKDLAAKVTGSPKPGLSFDEFKGEVARAMFSFDQHADPHVQAAAAKLRPIFDEIGETAAKEGVFSWQQRRLLRELNADLDKELGLKRTESFGLTEDRTVTLTDHTMTPHAQKLTEQIAALKAEIEHIDGGGWREDAKVKGESWFPKLLDRQTIMRNAEDYKGIVRSYFKSIGIVGDELEAAVKSHFDKVTKRTGYVDFFDDPVNSPRSAKAREWEIPASMVMNYIDTDVERILHRYVSQMGAAIEVSRAFEGHLDLKPMLDKVKLDYDAALREAGGEVSALERLNKEYVQDKEAILAMRDMIFGTHNIPADPDAFHTRAFRSMKVLNAASMLGGVVLSSLSDVARPVMTEGLTKTMRYGIDAFMMDKALYKLSANELHAAGIANELWTHTRAASFSNWNEIWYGGTKLERGIEKIGNVFSMASGLSQWTDIAKTVAGTVIGNRILDDCLLLAEGKLSAKATEDLARGGIGVKQAKAIAKMTEEHADVLTNKGWFSDGSHVSIWSAVEHMREKGGSLLANTDKWTDAEARMAFRSALYEDTNRAVVTPHIADRPLWVSTELGGILGQFKAFGMSSTQRIMMAGLQDRDAKFWGGMAAMTAAGMFANAIKDAIQRNENWFDRPWQDKLVDGMDRSGLLGSFGDINNLVERLSENQVSLNALLGDDSRKHTSSVSKWGALGPAPQQIARAFAMVGDLGRGEFGEAGSNFRRLAPLAGLWYFQPGIHALNGMATMVDGPSHGMYNPASYGMGLDAQPTFNQVH
ncbi:hypothetical protein [Magnetospirillum sp. XM-1]|uniref:hypothetical protein n=1 Tax=Magnetospirillum sp. XM-1 TaxID=1663591 RepID=UPI0012E3E7E7|nr:hypothetical protein [Magnetospirillum sp. XM-1]